MKNTKKTITTIFLGLILTATTMAQTKEANPADVATLDGIMSAVYNLISGDAGQKRDWDRFRTLFHPQARMIPTGKNPNTNLFGATALTPDDYIKRAGNYLEKEGFHESEIGRKTEIYGNIAQVFSAYEGKHKLTDKKPFLRGINSFQLLNDGKRWWVVTIFWQQETPDNIVPKKYLKSDKGRKQ
jgi:hypothetical protein